MSTSTPCARCNQRPSTYNRRHDSRALCGPCYLSCASCGRHRDTRHPAPSELCQACYRKGLKALQALLVNATMRDRLLEALSIADRALVRVDAQDERARHGAHGPAVAKSDTYTKARSHIADLRLALGDRP